MTAVCQGRRLTPGPPPACQTESLAKALACDSRTQLIYLQWVIVRKEPLAKQMGAYGWRSFGCGKNGETMKRPLQAGVAVVMTLLATIRVAAQGYPPDVAASKMRSEERRVGKEC